MEPLVKPIAWVVIGSLLAGTGIAQTSREVPTEKAMSLESAIALHKQDTNTVGFTLLRPEWVGTVTRTFRCGGKDLHKEDEAWPEFGEFQSAHSHWSVHVSEADRKVQISRPTSFGGVALSPSEWRAKSGWFVFVESDERVWAYDGDHDLYLLATTKKGGGIYGPRYFPCLVPEQVLTRLSEPGEDELDTSRFVVSHKILPADASKFHEIENQKIERDR